MDKIAKCERCRKITKRVRTVVEEYKGAICSRCSGAIGLLICIEWKKWPKHNRTNKIFLNIDPISILGFEHIFAASQSDIALLKRELK